MRGRKIYFLPDPRAPEVTAENVKFTTYFCTHRWKNVYLWEVKDREGLVAFPNVTGPVTELHGVNWYPKDEATRLIHMYENSQDPTAIKIREVSQWDEKFHSGAFAMFDYILSSIEAGDLNEKQEEIFKRQEEIERKKMNEGC